MSLSIGGGNINPNPQQTVFENVVTTQDTVANKGVTGSGNKVIIQPNTDDILFTQLNKRTLDKYQSEPGRPTILPAGSFRAASPQARTSYEEATDLYNMLLSELPLEMQQLIREARDQDALVLKEVLQDAAKMLEVQQRVLVKIETQDALARAEINNYFPIGVFRNVARVGKEMVETAREALNIFTANDPEYLPTKEFINGLEGLLDKAKLPKGEA